MYKSRSANIIASAVLKESGIKVPSEACDAVSGMKKVATTTLGKLNRAVKDAKRETDKA